jgi:hypothetical protein
MLDEREKPPLGNDGFSEMSSAGCLDNSEVKPPRQNTQAKFQGTAAEITCASMRADELRDGLVRDISHLMALGLAAQEALHAGDDEAALTWLRKHWLVMRADVSPRAAELGALSGSGAVP